MLCKKCHKTIPDGSLYCNFCGKKQATQKRKSHRRSNGTGQIYPDTRNHDRYVARSPSTLNGGGRKYLGTFKSYAEASAAIEHYLRGEHIEREGYTLGQLYIEWSETHFPTLSKSGVQSYVTAYRYLEKLEHIQMSKIKTADYQCCINACAEKYGRAQCDKVKQLCSQLCKYAMQNDIIEKNYASFIKLPKEVKKEKEVFTRQELEQLWKHKEDPRIAIILILCYTGFRIGELFDVVKENVHLDEGYIIGGKKTQAGTNRTVPLLPAIHPLVEKFYNSSSTHKLINKDVSNYRKREFYPALAELGIINEAKPRLTPHCTRHTFATLAKDAGMDRETLQKILGHAKYETTADIYIHTDIETLIQEMQRIK